MKIDQSRDAASIACPTCGNMFGADGAEEQIDPVPGTEVIHSDDPSRTEVVPDPNELFADGEIDLAKSEPDISPLPNSLPEPMLGPSSTLAPGTTAKPTSADAGLPSRRRDEYKMPELISNLGERLRGPGAPGTAPAGAPALDPSRIASTNDERLAAEPVVEEEGKIQGHIARKITGWDLEDDEEVVAVIDQRPAWAKLVVPIGIGAVSLMFGAVLVYGVIWSIGRGDKEPEPDSVYDLPETADLARQKMTENERMVLDDPKVTYAKAGETIGKFLGATNYKDRLQFVREPERVEPFMAEYYRRNPDVAIEFREPENGWHFGPFNSFLVGNVVLANFSNLAIAVERQEDGEYLVDWESFVAYSEIPWSEIKDRRKKEPFLLRARASIAAYYNFGFQDGEWACIQLQDKESEHTFYGYIKFANPVLREMGAIMSRTNATHVTVMVKYPEDDRGDNQLLITEAVASGWVFKEKEEDETDDIGESAETTAGS